MREAAHLVPHTIKAPRLSIVLGVGWGGRRGGDAGCARLGVDAHVLSFVMVVRLRIPLLLTSVAALEGERRSELELRAEGGEEEAQVDLEVTLLG